MSTKSRLQAFGAAAVFAIAADARADDVSVTEQPGHVTEASITVEASPEQIYELVTDYARWPRFLHDIKTVKVEAGGRPDAKVRFQSDALGHEVAVKFDNVENRAIRFHSVDAPPGAAASGTYLLEPLDGGTRTRVVASFYLDVHGAASLFVGDKKLRTMRQNKLRADLGDVAAQFTPRARAATR